MTLEFWDEIKRHDQPHVIDIGAAFGVASIPALEYGAHVIANDIADAHLCHIEAQAQTLGYLDRLRILNARLPALPAMSNLDAIHASNVLHFLTGAEITVAADWMIRALKPGRKAYLQMQSPFCGHFRAFFPEYEFRRQSGMPWPGEIQNARDYADLSIRELTAPFNHVIEKDIATRIFTDAGFSIEYCEYYTRPGLPEVSRLDGRENLGLIVVKGAT
jgi:hypothetical protein